MVVRSADVMAQARARGIGARQALEELVAVEVLARAAADGATALDADDRERLHALEVQALLRRDIEPRLALESIPDGDVRQLYERGKQRFVHGRLVEVAVLCVFTGARMNPEPRARAAETAKQLSALVAARRTREAADFAAIAAEPAWVSRQVSATTVLQGEDTPFPAVVGRAAQALTRPGDTTALVGDETGYYIARYVSEKPPETVTFEQAAPRLRAEMYEPWRRRRFLEIVRELANGHEIEILPDRFPLLVEEETARAGVVDLP